MSSEPYLEHLSDLALLRLVLEPLSSDTATFEQCGDTLISAIAALDTPRAHELLLGFVDPQVRGIEGNARRGEYGILIDRLADLAVRKAEIRTRPHLLCERSLASFNRYILSKVLQRLGQPDDEMACLNLVDDVAEPPIPQGVWDLLENAFVERRPDQHYANAFTQHARGANQLRKRLFQMAIDGPNRRVSAWKLLGQIEEWRIEHGRPASEPRHPDLASGRSWPLASP